MATHCLLILLFFLVPNLSRGDSPLEFEYRETVHWNHLGPSVSAGNGLYVAYNGSHTHVMDVNSLQNGTDVQENGYKAWRLIETNIDGPSARDYHHAMAFAMASLGNGKVLMYGGDGNGVFLNDAWIFTLSSNEKNGKETGTWTRTADGPSARRYHAMASLGNGKVLLYGGDANGVFNDTWIFTLSSNEKNGKETGTWTRTADGPSARFFLAMSSLGNGKVLLYGGANNGVILNDAWIFTLSSNEKNGKETGTWTQTADGPSARADHAMASLGNGKVLMYGGFGNGVFLNDAWIFTLSSNEKNGKETGTWTRTADGPSARAGHAMASLGNGKVLLYGGRNNGDLHDAWIFTLSSNEKNGKETGTWTRTADGPSARRYHAMSSLGNGKVLMYGGNGNDAYLNDAWIFTLSSNEKNGKETGTWTQTADGPRARYGHAMASLGNGKVLMYGGLGNNGDLNDAWIFTLSSNEKNGKETGTWTQTADGPSARASHAMASLGNGKVLMYGGFGNGVFLNDAWIFTLSSNEKNGKETGTWTRTADGPSARAGHAMASLGNGKVLLYGGRNNGDLHDAWIFTLSSNEKNGKETGTWTRTADGPSARRYHAMSSLGNGKVLMYGGNGNDAYLNDAWIFTLSSNEKNGKETGTWTQTADGPRARYGHAMASLGNGKVLMYGGLGNNGDLNDAWIFTLSSNEKNGKETGTWTQTADGPSARDWHAMASLGNGKVLLYGGGGNYGLLNDVWMYHGGEQGIKLATWSRLDNAMFKRSSHAMAPIILSDTQNTKNIQQIVMFGGNIDPITASPHPSKDVWTMSTGCPPGSHGESCDLCPKNQWKSTTTNETTDCTSCPFQTTTGFRAATSENQCVLCLDYDISSNTNGTCSVDLTDYTPEWRCFGTWGPECKIKCPGTTPCSGHGKCDDGVNGTGRCTCDFAYGLSNDCSVPWTGILVGLAAFNAVIIISGIIVWYRKRRKETAENHGIELEIRDDVYRLLEDDLEETKNDNSKLQKSRIIKLTDIKLAEVIGKGAFGEVRKGRWRGLDVAVKKMFPEEMEKFGYDKMLSTKNTTSTSNTNGLNEIANTMLSNHEIGVMMRLNHPRIVAFLGFGEIVDPPLEGDNVPRVGIFVMLEYAAGGDLIHRLKAAAGSTTIFPWIDRIQCAMDIAEGMQYIHSQGFLHRDLKSLNVLCDDKGRCMIADLGLVCSNIRPDLSNKSEDYEEYQKIDKYKAAKSIQYNYHIPFGGDTNYNTKWQGTAAWMAPEVTRNNYGFKADVYSFGIVMYELLTCRIPWNGSGFNFTHLIVQAVLRGERPEIIESDLIGAPLDFIKLMEACWDTDPKVRPTFDEIFVELEKAFKLCQNHKNGNGKNKINITVPRDRPLQNKETKSNEYLTALDGTVFTLPSVK